ncbi:putative amidophosphoribosyltransferase [Helianthus annuus]|uniref:Amidophosphoribosyltransferase n=1 Tax=Helianthus annuus TaxID=4232 RepID=A0A251TI52_HELAN|nr:putative amidophosphoribosyltransferase [Helianthus annuus]KAJ0512933.1 putative amidophosphoribosyltransferase [Helianthus annuus]KAJ0529056.1 putative amidophosphoribosyltransferase [Helianthus annuus]
MPLFMGRRRNGAIVFALEMCALDLIEANYNREVEPGKLLIADKDGVQSTCLVPHPEPKSCVFEHIYFRCRNRFFFGKSVYESRRKFWGKFGYRVSRGLRCGDRRSEF